MPRCKAIIKTGQQCKLPANDSGFCHLHDPQAIENKKKEQEKLVEEQNIWEQSLQQPRFSQRKGFSQISKRIQIDDISPDLKNSLWNVFYKSIFYIYDQERKSEFFNFQRKNPYIDNFTDFLWNNYFHLPLNLMPTNRSDQLNAIYTKYKSMAWFEIYDFTELILNYWRDDEISEEINNTLSVNLSGYRYIEGIIAQINNEDEIQVLEEALTLDIYPAVSQHLKRALELMSDRQKPDYRNSIKESISAIESLAQEITGDHKATLGKALDKIETQGKQIKIHPALRAAYSSLYGYTSDEGGIRHAMMDEPNLYPEDAKFFLFLCSSFINYVKSKL
jgi:hypothetical protein